MHERTRSDSISHDDRLGTRRLAALEVLVEGRTNVVATLQWNSRQGFWVDSHDSNGFLDRWGHIHARKMHPSFYNPS